jgi:outer membrane protein assembly factor BamB
MARIPRKWMPLVGGSLAIVFWLASGPSDLSAQQRQRQLIPRLRVETDKTLDDGIDNVFVPADRAAQKKLLEARRLLDEGRFAEAVRNLGAILEEPEDFLVQPNKSSPGYQSLKAEARQLIGRLPKEGRNAYELEYGARARRMLDEALQSGNVSQLEEVWRRFVYTRSGDAAAFLLAENYFAHHQPLAAALILQRLLEAGSAAEEMEPNLSLTAAVCWLQAGMPERARQTLTSLRDRHPTLRVAVGGQEVPIFTDHAKAVEWLVALIGSQQALTPAAADGWLMFRGDAARNASAGGSAPLLNMRWRVPATDDPLAASTIAQYEKTYAEEARPVLPALHPLAVGNVLLMRTLQNLWAIDIATGKRLWNVPENDAAELPAGTSPRDVQMRQNYLAAMISQRLWSDTIYGTLSSDGRSVFSVEDLEQESTPGAAQVFRRVGGFGRRRLVLAAGVGIMSNNDSSSCNRLAAHEIRSGKLLWQLGGPAGQYAPRQPDTFFLGPPLPLMGQLYVLAETGTVIRLLALDAATGNLLWSQQLASAEQHSLDESSRRSASVSPSYADGILVCPTAAGAVVGVDLATRSLLWGYCYNQSQPANRRNNGFIFVGGGAVVADSSNTQWVDASATITAGRVLLTPLESDQLYCLSLIDGKLSWKCPRGNDLYVACADAEKVVLVGRGGVRARRLTDGKPVWDGRNVAFSENSYPSGRGFLSGSCYFVPLSNAEVVAVDLALGRIVQVSKCRQGTVPGNLICHQGKVISQGLEAVDAYGELKAVREEVDQRLAANPKDPEALSLHGEILLDEGKRSAAIASFRQAYALDTDPRTRELFRDALLGGLRTEFSAYRTSGTEIERLLDDPSQWATYLRLMAGGLRQADEAAAALGYYEKLIDLEPGRRPLDQLSKTRSVRRDRWLRRELADLRGQAKGPTAEQMDRAVEARLKAAQAAAAVEPLQQFCDYFGELPAAAAARSELVRRLEKAGRLLEAELTAPSVAAAKSAGHDTAKHDSPWPKGLIETTEAPTRNGLMAGYGRTGIDLRGSPDPFFRDCSLQFDQNRQTVIAMDGWGRKQWEVSLTQGRQPQAFPYGPWTQARGDGHLLLVSLGSRIVAIDTLGSKPGAAPKLLWSQDLTGADLDQANRQAAVQFGGGWPWQFQQQLGRLQGQSSLLGAVGHQYVCAQRLRNLLAVDPRNGEILWIRQDMPQGCLLFGDDEYVFALPNDREEATVLRAADGERVGTRKVPRLAHRQKLPSGEESVVFSRFEETCLATLGRNLLIWWPEANRRLLTLVDPLEGRDLWAGKSFSANARTCVVDDEAVGVMEPGGRFVLVSLSDGRTIADVKLEAEPTLMDISLVRSGEQYLLLTNSALLGGRMPNMQPMHSYLSKAVYRGKLYAFDRQGNLAWPAPAEVGPQCMLLDQPSHLPVICFACQRYDQRNGQMRFKVSLLMIDKRTGKAVFTWETNEPTNIFQIVGDGAKKTIDVVLQQKTLRLAFTDKPIPPPAAKPAKPAAKTNSARALWNAIQKVLVPGDDSESEEEESP